MELAVRQSSISSAVRSRQMQPLGATVRGARERKRDMKAESGGEMFVAC